MVPRYRMIRPEFWEDEGIAKMHPYSRLLYIGTWNFADDEGKGRANPNFLRSSIFPYEPKLKLEKYLGELVEARKVILYGVDGENYYFIPKFTTYQKINHPTQSTIPDPPEDSLNPTGGLQEDSGSLYIKEVKLKKVKLKEVKRTIYELWNSEKVRVHKKFTLDMKQAVTKALNNYDMIQIKQAMRVYASVLRSRDTYWTYTWGLIDFLQRGLKQFVDMTVAEGLVNYKTRTKENQKTEYEIGVLHVPVASVESDISPEESAKRARELIEGIVEKKGMPKERE